MSSINTEQFLGEGLIKALAHPVFPNIDAALRSGRHITSDEVDAFSLLSACFEDLEAFYRRYHVELIKAPEGFFYIRPRSTTLIGRSVLSEMDMLVGKVLCYLYLSPERLANEGIFRMSDLVEELHSLASEKQLLRLLSVRSGGTDIDKKKLNEKIRTSMRRMRRMGMISVLDKKDRFRIHEAVFRFGADARTDEDPREQQLRLIRQGEAVRPEDMSQNAADSNGLELDVQQLSLGAEED